MTRPLATDMPGGHSEWEPPDPFPNSEVKTPCADASVDFVDVKVGHCQALDLMQTGEAPDGKPPGVFLLCAGEIPRRVFINGVVQRQNRCEDCERAVPATVHGLKPRSEVGLAWTTSSSHKQSSRCRTFASAPCRWAAPPGREIGRAHV